MPGCNGAEETARITRARRLMATYDDMAELIRIGAYRTGGDPQVDEAIRLHGALENYLAQDIREEATDIDDGHVRLARLLEDEPVLDEEGGP